MREGLALNPEARYQKAQEALHAIGVWLSVDDFGKGYQAMSYMKQLPLSAVSIDRSFIRDIAASASTQDVIGMIQKMCMQLDSATK